MLKGEVVTFRSVILAALIMLVPQLGYTANYYVRDGGTGTGCTDWTSTGACDAISTALAIAPRGSTIYVADGVYSSATFSTPESGATYTYVKKATATVHGTEMGWSSTYGDGDATFTSWSFSTGYYDIDGQVGKWASDLPGYQAYGIKVQYTATGNNSKVINFPSPGPRNIIIRHVEASFTNTPVTGTWYTGMDVVYAYGTNITFENSWFHDGGRVIMLAIGADYITFDHCVLERNGQAQRAMGWSSSEHSEIAMFQTGATYGVIRYSYIRDWSSTGGIILYDQNNNMEFYGNVWEQTGGYTTANSNGALNGLSAGTGLSAVAYNNTFVNLDYGCTVFTMGSFASRITKNNIFYDCKVSETPGAVIGGTHDYNWFYNSGTQSEVHIQYGLSDPFVSSVTRNYHLSSATDVADTTIGATYNIDPDGITRGVDGVWDRGAYEFGGGAPPSVGVISGGATITGGSLQ